MKQIINFEISNYCNLKCPLCSRNTTSVQCNNTQVDINDFEDILFSNNLYFKNCICKFCGEFGDPLTHHKIDDFIDISSSIFSQVLIYTNGSIKNSKWYSEKMVQYKNLFFHFGIDGTTNKINNLYRKNSNIKKIIDNMTCAASIDSLRVKWEYINFDWNKHQIDDAKKIASNLNIDINIRENSHTTETHIIYEINEKSKYLL